MVALLGGSEHTAGCESIDRALLRQVGVRRAEVVVLLAASPQRRRAFKQAQAETWWRSLGARARCVFAGEGDPAERAAALLDEADVIVVTGGRPWLLRRRLEETGVGVLVERRWHAGVPVAGSSAGAMALAAAAWSLRPPTPLRTCRGLGLVPGTLVAPHAGRHGIDTWAALTQRAQPALDVLGIPDQTALLVHPDGSREVIGREPIVSYGSGYAYCVAGTSH